MFNRYMVCLPEGVVPWLENLERSEVWTKEGGGSTRLKSPLIGIEHEEIPLSPMNMSIFHNHEDVHEISHESRIKSHSISFMFPFLTTFFVWNVSFLFFRKWKCYRPWTTLTSSVPWTWGHGRAMVISSGWWWLEPWTFMFHFIYIYN